MAIIHPRLKRTKPANSAKKRQLDAEWQALLAKHAKPLERGATSKGMNVKVVKTKTVEPLELVRPVLPTIPKKKELPEPIRQGPGGTVPAVDPLASEKHALKARLGQSYNKGTIQFLTDDELAEQRTGAHKRR